MGRLRDFDQSYQKTETGCWEWQGPRDRRGYGLARWQGRRQKAHRVSLFRLNIDCEGLCVCHSCDNPSCVNPEHLWVGTRADNNRDRDLKGRRRGNRKLTDTEIQEIKQSKETPQVLSQRYPVHASQIRRIQVGEAWKNNEE